VIEYAGARHPAFTRTLSPGVGTRLESGFLERLAQAKSNLPEHEKRRAALYKVGETHHRRPAGCSRAITPSALCSKSAADVAPIYCYRVGGAKQFQRMESGNARAVVGRRTYYLKDHGRNRCL